MLVLIFSTLQNGHIMRRNAFHFIEHNSPLLLYVFWSCLYILIQSILKNENDYLEFDQK